MQQSHITHTSQWKGPASGLDAQGSLKAAAAEDGHFWYVHKSK